MRCQLSPALEKNTNPAIAARAISVAPVPPTRDTSLARAHGRGVTSQSAGAMRDGKACVLVVALLATGGMLALMVLGGMWLSTAMHGGSLGLLDTEIKRWWSKPVVPLSVRSWANHTAATACRRLDGRQVIIVGNAPTVRRLGATIDKIDVVVRVNPAAERGGHHGVEHRGRRANALHVNSNHPAGRITSIFSRFPDAACVWSRTRAESAIQLGLSFSDRRIDEYDARRMAGSYAELRGCGPITERFLTAGMLAVLHALDLGARKPVRVAGITAFLAAGHDVTNYSNFHEENLRRYHCVENERRLLQRLVREGAVSVVCDAARLFARESSAGQALSPGVSSRRARTR